MRPEGRVAVYVFAAAALALVAGCSRVTLLRQDTSRGDFRRTAPEVEIKRDDARRTGAESLVQVAQARLLTGDARGALDAAQRAVKQDPTSAEAHSLLALGMESLGRVREAGAHHRRAAELAPARGALLNNYGAWLCGNERIAESFAWFERAWTSAGYSTPDAALANAGTCALQAGDRVRASGWLRQAIGIAPTNAAALRALAEIALHEGRALEARAFIERRLAAAPADADSLLLASQIEKELGDMAASTRYVHRMRAEFPRTPDSAAEGGNR